MVSSARTRVSCTAHNVNFCIMRQEDKCLLAKILDRQYRQYQCSERCKINKILKYIKRVALLCTKGIELQTE